MRTYYTDEIGNTGDAVRTGDKFDFGAQHLFTLACIGIDDPAGLEGELARLKTLHGMQSVELKSSSIRNKRGFVRDLIAYLKRQRCPLFIEVADKKFFICAQVVSTLLMPPVGEIDNSPEAHYLRNVFAEYFREHLPDQVRRLTVDACGSPSRQVIDQMFAGIVRWLNDTHDNDEIAKGATRIVDDTWTDFKQLNPDEDYMRFLPNPDKGKRDQTYWMLPNLSCKARLTVLRQ